MEIFFNLFKVKFAVLHELLRNNPDITIDTEDTVNIFINLESILTRLCNIHTIEYVTINKNAKIEFISNVINLAAHYRLFFSKYKIRTKIYLYMPSLNVNTYKNSIYNDDYRIYYKFRFSENAGNTPIYKMITETIPFLHLITEYIDGVYFIESNQVENSLVPYIIEKENNNKINFIISGDIYDIQMVNHNFNVILPKGDNSFICTDKNIINYLIDVYDCKGTYNLSSNFLPFIISIVGSKNRNIYSIKGIGVKKIFKLIQKALDAKQVSNNIDNINLLLNITQPSIRDELLRNYYCTNVTSQYSQLSKKDIYDITSQIKDKFDNIALKAINDKYFTQYPIMLQEVVYTPIKRKEIKF